MKQAIKNAFIDAAVFATEIVVVAVAIIYAEVV